MRRYFPPSSNNHHLVTYRRISARPLTEPHDVLTSNSVLAAHSRDLRFRDVLALFRASMASNRFFPDPYSLSIAAKAAAGVKSFASGGSIHSLALRLGHTSDFVLSNSIMSMYFRCRRFGDARKLFDEMPVRSAVSWNSLIAECAGSGQESVREEAWGLLGKMQEEGFSVDGFTLCAVLPLCGLGSAELVLRGRAIHGFAVRRGFYSVELGSDSYVVSCLIGMYLRCGDVAIGTRIFERSPNRNVVTWTSMIGGYVQNEMFEEALKLFRDMQTKDAIRPNKVSLLSLLSGIGSVASNASAKEVHCFAIRSGFNGETSLNNSLIDSYSKCGDLDSARKVFDDVSWEKDMISWSTMLFGNGIHGKGEDSIALFHQMCELGVEFNPIACVGIISACGRSGLVSEGAAIYEILVQGCKVVPTMEMYSAMVDMFCRSGQLDLALEFVDMMPIEPGASIWGSIFSLAATEGNKEIQDLAYDFLLQSESSHSSNQVSLSNSLASSGRWDDVAEIRSRMKDKGLEKFPGYSWICIDGVIHSFFAADKCHQYAARIYQVLDSIVLTMKGENSTS